MSITKAEMVEALREASKLGYLGGSGGGGGGGPSASSGADWGKKFTGAADAAKDLGSAALGAGSKIAEGGARMHDATDALSKGFAGLGVGSGVFGAALAKGTQGLAALGQNIDQNIDTWRKLSDTGLAFGNDIMEMKNQASAARMSIAEMSEVMQKNNSSMLGFGATSADSAKKLSKMSNEFFTSGLGEQLRGMGYTTKELNDVLAVSISGSKLKDLKDKDGQDRSLKAAASLATEMDAVAKITGQSKQEQLDELRRKATDGQRMAAIDEAIAKGGVGAKEAFDAISANGKLMGPQFQKLAEDMASMGRPSEGMEQAYGLLSADAKKLMSEAGEAARSGDRERAAMLTKQAAAEQAAFQNTSQYRTMAAQAGIKETQESYAQGAKFRNALADAGGNINNVEESMKKLDEQVKKEQQAGGKDDPAPSAGASITRFAVDVESRGRDLTKALNDQVIQPLVKDIGPKLKDAGKAMGITAQKGDVSKEDQKKIDAEKDPTKKAALQSAAEDKKAATVVDRNVSEPMKAGYDKSRIATLVGEEVRPGAAVVKDSSMQKDLLEFRDLIKGNQKQSDAALKVLNDMAAKENANAKATDKPVTGADVAVRATNTPGGLAEINKAINKELGDTAKPPTNSTFNPSVPVVQPNERSPAMEGVGKGVEALGNLFRDGKARVIVDKLPATTLPPVAAPVAAPIPDATPVKKETRAGGSLEMAGKMFEDWGKGTMVELHGLEGVMRPQDISKVIESAMGGVRKTMPKLDVAGAEKDSSKLEMPKLEMPEMPKLEMPKMGKEFEVLSSQMTKMNKSVDMPKLEMPKTPSLDISKISKDINTTISSVSGGKETTTKGPDMKGMSMSMAKMGMNDDQKKVFDEMMSLSSQQSKEKLQSLVEEKASAQAANIEAAKARDAIEERLEAEGKGIKDLVGADKERFDALTQQMNSSADAQDKAKEAITAAERAEENRLSLQKMGYEVGIKQEEDKVKIVEDNSEKIKADIADALPVKDIADKVEEAKTVLSDHQKSVLKYAYEDSEGKQMQLDNQKNRIKSELNGIAEKNKSIESIQQEAEGRELTQREQNRIERLQKEIEGSKESLKFREEELFVYENLDKLKAESAVKTASILEEKTEKINNDITSALPVDTGVSRLDEEVGKNKADDDIAAMQKLQLKAQSGIDIDSMMAEAEKEKQTAQAAWDSAVPAKLNDPEATKVTAPKKNIGDMMGGLSFGPTGMPIMKSVDAAKQSLNQKTPSPGKKINPETGEEYTPVEELAKQQGKKAAAEKKPDSKAATKESTLSDVVSALNTLNKQMGQLIAVSEEGHKSTTKATKSTAGNIYAR